MDQERLRACVEDTLHYRGLEFEGCFAWSRAARDLEDYGEAALPVIEEVIRVEVAALAKGGEECVDDIEDAFLGVNSLFIEYLHIGSRVDLGRVESFLRGMPVALQFMAIRAGNTTFRGKGNSVKLDFIPDSLRELFREFAAGLSGTKAEFAMRVVNTLYRKDQGK